MKIRESVSLWKQYARGAPLLVDEKDILDILDAEDALLAKDVKCNYFFLAHIFAYLT